MQAHRLITDLDELMDEIRMEIDKVSDTVIEHYLRRAIILFCEKSHWWLEDVGPIRVVTDITNYDVGTSRYSAIVSIEAVSALNDDDEPVWFASSNDSSLTSWRFWPDSTFSMDVHPNDDLVDKDLTVICSLKPRIYNSTFKVSEPLVEEYRDALVAGAKSLIYKIPNKEWTDLNQAGINDGIFEQYAGIALRQSAQGFSRLPRRVTHKARDFF